MRDLLGLIRSNSEAPPTLEAGFVREVDSRTKQFFQSVNEIRGLFNIINENTSKLNAMVQTALTVVRESELNRHLNQIDTTVAELNRYMLNARGRIKELDADNQAFEQTEMAKPERERNMTDVRMRKTQVDTLNASFVEIMGSVQKAQGEYRSQFRARIERQYKIAKPDATEAEIEAALDQKRPIFAEQILSGAGQAQRAEAMQLLESIRERHEHIIKLEESIKELRQMFNDMAILVQQQGEVLNDIEKSVESAVNYTDKGLSDMKVSLKLQKKTRKKMCILFCCIVILLVIILAPTLASVLK